MQHGGIVSVDGGVRLLIQQALIDQAFNGGVRQIGVDRPCPVAQQRSKMMYIPRLGRFEDHRYRRALAGTHQMLLQRRNRQQRRDRHMVFVHATVRKDDDVGAVPEGPVCGDPHLVERALQRGVFVVEDRYGFHPKAGQFHRADLHKIQTGKDGMMHLQHAAVFGILGQQVAVVPKINGGIGNDFFPDGVDGRIGYLREHLLEVIEKRLVVFRKHRQRDINAHRGGGLRPGARHGQNGVFQIFVVIAKRLLQTRQCLRIDPFDAPVGNGQILQPHQVPIQPFSVGVASGVSLFDLVVRDHPAFYRIHQKHLARLQPGFLDNMGGVKFQHAYLGGKDQPPVIGEIVPGGAQAVAVQHGAHLITVRKQNGSRAVPRLHHHGIVLVKIPPRAGEAFVFLPWLRNADHHGKGQFDAAHHQKFKGVVQHGRIRTAHIHHRQHLVYLFFPYRSVHRFLTGQHAVGIAPDGVDLSVVQDQPVRVGPFP